MSKSNSNPASDFRQLSLFEQQFNDCIRRAIHNGVEYFSLIDMMTEFSDTEANAGQYWRDTKKRLVADGFQLQDQILQLKLKARDGKMRQTDCADGRTCLRIIQSIPSAKAEPIRQWLAALGYERIEENRNPGLGTQRAKERDLALLKAQGYNNKDALQHLEARIDSMAGFKSLMETVQRVVESPQHGVIVNAEYVALFGEITTRLRELLSTDNIRDKLPPLQLSYLRTAELTIKQAIQYHERLTMPDLLAIIEQDVVPLGNLLRTICERHGVHHVTGQVLLTS